MCVCCSLSPILFLLIFCELATFSSSVPIIPIEAQLVPQKIADGIEKAWTDESLCVLKMGSSCPNGFAETQLRLSVQTAVNPKDTDRQGNSLISLGKAGETSLTRNVYDDLYTLTLTTCCK